MILDSVKNSARYYGVNPRLKRAFDYLETVDLHSLASGKYEIDGTDIFMTVIDRELKRPADAKLEIHRAYLDIQVVIAGEESFGWSECRAVKQSLGAFDLEKDIELFDDRPQTYYTLIPGQFTIFLPEDAHAPMVGEGMIKKIIMKVRM
ncbi:MAG: YhcH/YjgK/YiaL family protein [Alistipes sp.]